MYACICHAVTTDEIDAVVAGGARDVSEIGRRCGAGTGCGTCVERLQARCQAAVWAGELQRV